LSAGELAHGDGRLGAARHRGPAQQEAEGHQAPAQQEAEGHRAPRPTRGGRAPEPPPRPTPPNLSLASPSR
jgi:hypothetical protein